jgi:uncharacterized DUF497 family protein
LEFEWDANKHQRNLREKGFGFEIAARIFEGRIVERQDVRFDYFEVRMVAVGQVENRVLTVVYTMRNAKRRIIAAWPANRKERSAWQKSQE